MPFIAFEGPAGTGKTFQLIDHVRARAAHLGEGQRVLGLTFMHGSRRRLDENFTTHPELRKRGLAITIDSFAAHILRRWNPADAATTDFTQFDRVCDASGALLEHPHVARWVAAAFPVVAIDEAQELKPCRLRIVRALENVTHMVVAADEYQCLDDQVDTEPVVQWLATGDVHRLDQVRRTDRQGLLNAGVALRNAQRPVNGAGLRIRYEYPNVAKFTVGHALRDFTTTRAILVAPGAARWATRLVPLLAAGMTSPTQRVPPLTIAWETPSEAEAEETSATLCATSEEVESFELVRRIKGLQSAPPWLSFVTSSVELARRARGVHAWRLPELVDLCKKKISAHRAYGCGALRGIRVMSIQAAKNRQFDDVVVLWGAGAPGDADHQRRLLYNAITRAVRNCTVVVQTTALLQQPPFV